MTKKFYLLFTICALLLPVIASAHQINLFPGGYWGPIVPQDCAKGGCANLCQLMDAGQHFIYLLMSLTVFAIGPILIVAGGIMMMLSGGSPERFGAGRKTIMNAIIAILISLGAFVIINTFLWFIARGSSSVDVSKYWPTIQCTSAPIPNSFQGVGASPY